MKLKSKGINAERELVHMLWERAWAAIRVAGSGASKYSCPDILAGKANRVIAVECKSTGGISKYIPEESVKSLKEFAELFGAEPWIGIRFEGKQWFFISPNELKKTEKGYSVSYIAAKKNGLSVDELLGNFKQLKTQA